MIKNLINMHKLVFNSPFKFGIQVNVFGVLKKKKTEREREREGALVGLHARRLRKNASRYICTDIP